jgi:two-component system OmpR family sensor kinase
VTGLRPGDRSGPGRSGRPPRRVRVEMSLRGRLLLGMALIAIVLGLAAVVIARTTEDHLVGQVDAQLHGVGPQLPRPGDLGSTTGNGNGNGNGAGAGQPPTGSTPRLSDLFVGRVNAAGVLTTEIASDLRDETPVLDGSDVERLRRGDDITVGSTASGTRFRVASRAEGRFGGMIVAALPLDDVDDAVHRLVLVEGFAVVAVLAVLGLVTWWVVRLGIRPLRTMTAAAGAIAAGDLSRRIPATTTGTEAGELGVALNGMLGRIEEAFDECTESESRLRQFIADASHELRTPVTTIRGYAELYRAGALDDTDALDDAMRRTEQESVRMGTLVDELLHLARLDQGRPLEQAPVDLRALAADAVLDAQAVAPDRAIQLEGDDPVVVRGDEARLRQVIANLVGNALVHAPGATIAVRVDATATTAVLEVVDSGPGMAPADAARAFDRFYRADASRRRHSGGSGLGLSIVDATVRAHHGTVSIDSRVGHGTTVRTELPLLLA